MSYEEAETIKLGELVRQFHFELTGQQLQLFEFPCHDAIFAGMEALRESERAVALLVQ